MSALDHFQASDQGEVPMVRKGQGQNPLGWGADVASGKLQCWNEGVERALEPDAKSTQELPASRQVTLVCFLLSASASPAETWL